MKLRPQGESKYAGMTLTEVIIALGLVAVLLPLALTLLSQSFAIERGARDDLRSSLIARQVVGQLDWVREEGRSEWFDSALPIFSGANGDLYLSFDEEGRFLGQINEGAWDDGVNDKSVSYLARVYLSDADGISRPPELKSQIQQLNIDVGSPAQAPLAARKIREFNKVVTLPLES